MNKPVVNADAAHSTRPRGPVVKRHFVAVAPDGTEFTRSSPERSYTHAVLVWCPGWRDQVWKWHIKGFCGSAALAATSAAARQKLLKPDERVEVVETREFTPLTARQRKFLLKIGDKTIEMFGTSHLVALVKRGLVERSFIGMRWWRVRRTAAGRKAVEV